MASRSRREDSDRSEGPTTAMPAPPTPLRARLVARARMLAEVRAFFESAGSVEVETPAVVRSPGVDAHVDAVRVTIRPGPGAEPEPRFLTTSPEYHMKRLLADGSGPIHQVAKAWRDGERGRLHEPEFTLLEWYVPGRDDRALMDQTEALVTRIASVLSGGVLRAGGCTASTECAFDRVSFGEVFERFAGVDPDSESERRMGRLLRASGQRPPRDASREELIDLLLAAVVQPKLGLQRPVFVTDWPADRAALARLRPDAGGRVVAARFELYACGVELCNGYHELLDASEQRGRIEAENATREALGKAPHPLDELFLAALERGLPDCAGNALGLDRLFLLLQGEADLDHARTYRLDA